MSNQRSETKKAMQRGELAKYVSMLAGASIAAASLALAAEGVQATHGIQPATEKASAPAPKAFHDLVTGRCERCHNSEDWSGGLAMDTLDLNQAGKDPEIWEKAIAKLRSRLMPPAGQPQPDQADVDATIDYLEATVDSSAKQGRVGHVPIQRLSRAEFAATVRDLVGVAVDPKQILPTEIEVDGFSNIAGALVISPSFMEQYLTAARKVAQRAVGEPLPKMSTVFYRGGGGGGGPAGPGSPSQLMHKDGYPLGTRGGVNFTHVFPADGQYKFNFLEGDSVDAGLYPRGMETEATMVVLVDGVEVARRQLGGPEDMALADRDGPKGRTAVVAKISGIPADVKAGAHEVTVTFIERSWAESNDPTGGGKVFGMPIIRDGIQVAGPFSPQGLSLSASRGKIFVCHPQQESEEKPCAERIARHLATAAFRRPATDADVKLLMKFYSAGRADSAGFDAGVTELVTAVLSSPDFLYRAISASQTPGESRPLSGLELASRLSFFLWNEGPDAQLIGLATQNKLGDLGVMKTQVDRMLKDPRAISLVDNFAFSWLNMGTLAQIEPLDPAFNAAMRSNFETEIRLFLKDVLLGDHSVTDLLTADYTFVNEPLARQYDIPGVYGPQFRRVMLKNENRWGLLGKGAVQLRTSYSDRTSPVLRGEYVLDRILGTPPTPPPPGVNTDLSAHEGAPPSTVRARLEAHRANPTCMGCHGVMDPYGLAMENFDVTGRWRDIDPVAKVKIDPTAELTNGVVLRGPVDLRRYLTRRPEQFPTTVTKRLMMYALNREVEFYDMPQVRKIVADAASTRYSFAALVTGIVNSDSFRRQGPEAPQKPPTQLATNVTSGSPAKKE